MEDPEAPAQVVFGGEDEAGIGGQEVQAFERGSGCMRATRERVKSSKSRRVALLTLAALTPVK